MDQGQEQISGAKCSASEKIMKNISVRILVVIIINLLFFSAAAQAQKAVADKGKALTSDELKEKRLQWFREARFGMMIHWGLYSVPAGEWKGKLIPGLGEWIMNRAKIP